ncbi:MAG TPA: carboxypeptidase regulatory-like domain-containing protein [Bryobacteraceae bacterium]|jgi:5-hydroxyisourate hydrolase-like protein (transthyretin family)|nr:carboxypeptidase regulatory-like domain-containing protein [Bryobacteraceae bacterium]
MLISGTVVDWTTGRPVPGVTVAFKHMNGSSEAAHTDASGRFTAVAPEERRPYWLFAADPRFGTLFQSTFGRVVMVYARGEQHSGVVVPAIPSAELSGHVLDADSGAPIPGCEVSALTKSADDDPRLQLIDFRTTDRSGAFSFRLGADRYFLLVNCLKYLPGEPVGYLGAGSIPWRVRSSWPPMLFPQLDLVNRPQAIVLLPGGRKAGIDFHLRSVRQYSIHGKVVFSDGSKPRAGVVSFHDMRILPSDPAVAAAESAASSEPCDWNATAGTFHCDFLSPGTYNLAFVSDGAVSLNRSRPQKAELAVEVTPQTAAQELTIHLHDVQFHQQPNLPSRESGHLDLRRVCPTEMSDPWIDVRAWGPTIRYLGLLRRHGVPVTIQANRTTHCSITVWRTEDIVRLALAFLGKAQ